MMSLVSPSTNATAAPTPQLHLAFADASHGAIAYDVWGNGRPILCMPGPGDLREEYDALAPVLAEAGYSPLVMDLRGMGQSTMRWPRHALDAMVQDVNSVLKFAERGSAIMMGCSTSASVAALMALREPQRVTGLVLISPVLFAERRHPSAWHHLIRIPALLRSPWGSNIWVRSQRLLYPTRPALLDAHLDHIRQNLSQRGRMHDLAEMVQLRANHFIEQLSQINVPTLIVVGERDVIFHDPRDGGAQLQARIPHSELAIIPGAGHYPHWETPAATNEAILGWLRRTLPST